MTLQMDCQIVRLPLSKSMIGRFGDGSALGRKSDTWTETIAKGAANAQQWSGDALAGSRKPGDGDCRDRTGVLCPALADARARQAVVERQLVEFNHRVANVLQMLAARVERQRRAQADPVARGELDQLLTSVQASARLHRYLLPQRGHARIDFGPLLVDLAAAINGVTGLRTFVEAESVDVSSQVAMQLAAAVNELAWNAHKHAYRGAQGGVLHIACRRDADARLLLSVADRGRGLPVDFDPRASEGLGLQVVYATVSQFGGELRTESDRGARFTLLLDLPRL
jgi:two-component sensor histidine kinase